MPRTYPEGNIPDPSWKSGPPDAPEVEDTPCVDGVIGNHCWCCDDYHNLCCWCGNERTTGQYEPPEQEYDPCEEMDNADRPEIDY